MNTPTFTREAIQTFKRLNVIYVDRSLVVLNKPPGLVTQGTLSNDPLKRKGTIQPILDELGATLGQREPLRTVHRLDKDTTGALLLARNPRIVSEIHRQMDTGVAKKIYYALVHSRRYGESSGVIETPLVISPEGHVSLEPSGRFEFGGDKVKNAKTRWERIASSSRSNKQPGISLLKLHLDTGYKHQLRVHLASVLDSPIIGDPKHGDPSADRALGIREGDLFLHCHELSLIRYKKDGNPKRFELTIHAPVPQAFRDLCEGLGIQLPTPEGSGVAVQVNGSSVSAEDLLQYTGGVVVS